MAEFKIPDEDLASLRDKVAVITGNEDLRVIIRALLG